MFKVLVLSHGNLSLGIKNTLELFEIDHTKCLFLQAYNDEVDPTDFIKDFMNITSSDKKIILTDLKSGSLTRIAIELGALEQDDIYLISGYNLALLIGILTQVNINKDIIDEVLEFSKQDIELIASMKQEENDLEAFF